jgi:carbon storage regulator
MDILTVSFEEPLVICIEEEIVKIIAFKTQELGNVKFGIHAPRSINVHRKEIYQAIQKKQNEFLID